MRSIILEKVPGERVVENIRNLIQAHNIPEAESEDVFNLVENEFISLPDGNVARFKVRPSEFEAWKLVQ